MPKKLQSITRNGPNVTRGSKTGANRFQNYCNSFWFHEKNTQLQFPKIQAWTKQTIHIRALYLMLISNLQ